MRCAMSDCKATRSRRSRRSHWFRGLNRRARRIDAGGRVVAPGFIDLHAHGQSDDAFRYRVRDGVTTALELESGYPRLAEWLSSRRGTARINYGASVAHGTLRVLAMPDLEQDLQAAIERLNKGGRRTRTVKRFPFNSFPRRESQQRPNRSSDRKNVVLAGRRAAPGRIGHRHGSPILSRSRSA